MDVKERLILLCSHFKKSPSAFERLIGMSNSYIRNAKSNIKIEYVDEILRKFPNVNRVWLLTGEGEMLIKDGSVEQNNIVGDNINGHNVTVGKSGDDYMKVIMQQSLQLSRSQEQLSRGQEQLSKSQEQIDRLITLLEKMSDKKE